MKKINDSNMLTLNNVIYNNVNVSFSIFLSGFCILDGNDHIANRILKSIAGLDKKTIDQILWNNQKISEIYYLYSSDINFIPKKLSLDQELTVIQNLNFLSHLTETNILINSAILYFELDNILNKKVKFLTKEEIQRVKLSQLIFSPKTIWLLERSDQFLSQKWQEKLFNLISTRIKENGIVIMVSNNRIFRKIGQIIKLDDFKITSKNI